MAKELASVISLAKIQWRVIEISDEPIERIDQTQSVAAGEIGELIVKGPVVTDQYVTRVEANADHKILDGNSFWHRMGDVGYLDSQDRFLVLRTQRSSSPHGRGNDVHGCLRGNF